jgi:hypothetical protein
MYLLVETSYEGNLKKLWNPKVQIDRSIPQKKPDIIIRNSEKGTCLLTGTAISEDRNVIKTKKGQLTSNTPGNHINETAKTATLGTAYMLLKLLM